MNTNQGPIQPKCSRETAAALAACSDDEIRGPCCYAAGSAAKVEWLRLRQERFGQHLVPGQPDKKFAKKQLTRHNVTAEEMDVLFWGQALDNPLLISKSELSRGTPQAARPHITKLYIPE